MKLLRKNKLNNNHFLLLQLIVIAVLFIFVFDKEAVFLLKDSLDRFQLSANIQQIIYRILIAVKMLCHSPSLFALTLFFLQIACVTFSIGVLYFFIKKPFNYVECKVETPNISVESYTESKKFSYLENLRLLN